MANWNQPMCDPCFRQQNPGREPMRLMTPEIEYCCNCGVFNTSGIYVRIDPDMVNFPVRGD